jgi:hypothetical protein
MTKLENLDSELYQPLTEKESDSILGGAFTFIGLTDRNGVEYNDYKSGDAVIIIVQPVEPVKD